MQQPALYKSSSNPTFVCRLHKALYGLKQSPRMWYHKFHSFMSSHGYTRLQSEPNIYIRYNQSVFLIIAIYVDDIPILSNNLSALTAAKAELSSAFSMTNLGPLEFCLGVQVLRDRHQGTIRLTQQKFVEEILIKYGMASCRPISTPLPVSNRLSLDQSPTTGAEIASMRDIPYSQVLGSVRYLVTCMRFDICYAAGFLSRFMQNPGPAHWQAVKRLLRYLQYSKDFSLLFSRPQSLNPPTPILGWSDSGGGY